MESNTLFDYNFLVDNIDRVRFILNEAIAIMRSGNQIVTTIHIARGKLSEPESGRFKPNGVNEAKAPSRNMQNLTSVLSVPKCYARLASKNIGPRTRKSSVHIVPYRSFGAKILTGEECYLECIQT